MKRVLVCGGRGFFDRTMLFNTLDGLRRTYRALHIIDGAAFGADSLASEWAVENDQSLEEYPADWTRFGRAAGSIRNQRMLDEGKPDLVVAFPGGRGTADMVRRAKAAGVEVMEIATPSPDTVSEG